MGTRSRKASGNRGGSDLTRPRCRVSPELGFAAATAVPRLRVPDGGGTPVEVNPSATGLFTPAASVDVPVGPLDYPNPDHLIVNIPPDARVAPSTPTIPPDSAIFVVTKDRSSRLPRTLPRLATLPCPIVLIDDSTVDAERRRNERIAAKSGVEYHGRVRQKDVMAAVAPNLARGLIVPLSSPGWTLGFCRNYA